MMIKNKNNMKKDISTELYSNEKKIEYEKKSEKKKYPFSIYIYV